MSGEPAPPAPHVDQPATPLAASRGAPPRRRKRLALGVFVLAALGFAVWYFAIRTPEPTDDLGRFQGEWRLAVPAVGRDGKPGARLVSGVTIRVTGDRWVYLDNGKEQRRYRLTLRAGADPKEIDLTQLGPDDRPTAFVIRGVYAVDRDRATVAHAPDPSPRPAALDAPDGGAVWHLERIK